MTSQELLSLHVQALFTHDERGRLLTINEPGGGAAASRFYLGRTAVGNLWRFHADLPMELVTELEALCAREPVVQDLRTPPLHLDAYTRLLEAHAPVAHVWMGPAYYFPQLPRPAHAVLAITEANAERLRGGFEELTEELPTWQPFVGLIEEERVVSVCRSVRITPAAHEAGVETLPDFRGRGYAKEVVGAWARFVHAMGAMPLYSTSWENSASQAVAKKLGLHRFGADFHIA